MKLQWLTLYLLVSLPGSTRAPAALACGAMTRWPRRMLHVNSLSNAGTVSTAV
jgi:hypothetical protein